VGRTLERVGDAWSLMILRDALQGLSKFDQFEKSLGVAPNILTDRLNRLVEAGLLERRRYSERPPRDEYRLTEMGYDFGPVMDALTVFGNRRLPRAEAAA
jgi:DNA-binding HxlR family transcriptional regulator